MPPTTRLPLLLLAALVLSTTACAASARSRMASAPMAAAEPATAPPPLDRSVFARDPNGQLGEDALQQILASPIELDLPARVGVLPIITATDWRGPNPDYAHVPAGVAPFVKRLRGSEPFTLVTEIMPIPSGALGMEALREIAARYRLRYVLLYRELVTSRTRLNPWAWGYATVVGAAFLPGQQHEIYGYMEASLFDVKTGLLLFTTRRSISGSKRSSTWYQDDKKAELRAALVGRFGGDLADDVKADLYRFAEAARVENDRARLAAAGAVTMPVPPAMPVAADPQ
ncbi:MAG TPA: hypothetical protein VM734_28305 [Kofleriaceae bacterium]|jgi:hypothetical protein|nr:hypothetical protein [Kofleriaceae bacterium]